MELDRVRAMGHERPEEVVVWTAAHDPGADHDIRSIDQNGLTRWIEVKSTTGTDGRFDWPRKEFEKALNERERYELWRVYKADAASPIAKFFPDPTSLLQHSQLTLDIGTLRAELEPLT